jgi:hypothetical protein
MGDTRKPELNRRADIDTGYDELFERKWGRFERMIWITFGCIMALGLCGFLGRGPLNKKNVQLADGTQIKYERVLRYKTPGVVELQLPVSSGSAELRLSKTEIEKLGLKQITPQPSTNMSSENSATYRFQPADPTTRTLLVQLALEPASVGPVSSDIQVNGQQPVSVHQWVVP